MAIKKYFIDNEMYGVDAMNKIVSSIRTTGIDGEIPDCLKVTIATTLSVSVAPGRGWVDGCQIELDATETRAVSSTAGTYSVIMQISKTGTQTDDIDIVVIPGSETGAHVLAHVTVSGNAIAAVTDVRMHSKFNGRTADPNPDGIAAWEPGALLLFSDNIDKTFNTLADGSYQELAQYMTANGGELDMEISFYMSLRWTNSGMVTPNTLAGYIKIYVDGFQCGDVIIRKGPNLHTVKIRLSVTAGSVISISGKTDIDSRDSITEALRLSNVKFYIGRKADAIARL